MYESRTWVTPEFKDMGYSSKVNQRVLPLGPLFAAEQSQPGRGVVGEHWASLVYASLIRIDRAPDDFNSIESVRELRSRPAWSSSAGEPLQVYEVAAANRGFPFLW